MQPRRALCPVKVDSCCPPLRDAVHRGRTEKEKDALNGDESTEERSLSVSTAQDVEDAAGEWSEKDH